MNAPETQPVMLADQKEPITREHLLKAIKKVDSEGVRPHRQSIDYDVIYEGKHYPPKYLISLANVHANGEELQPNPSWPGGKGSKAFKLLEQNGFVIEKRNAAENDGTTVRRNIWIEKSLVKDLEHRKTGDRALGKAMWSPQKDRGGADIYTNMRKVRKGDLVVHFIDSKHISGVSIVKSETVQEVDGIAGTNWDSESYLHELEGYTELDTPLSRHDILTDKHRSALEAISAEGEVFYNRVLNLRQGAHLTPCSDKLALLLDGIYQSKTGHSLPYFDNIVTDALIKKIASERRYWLYAPGENARKWEKFYADSVMAIGWGSLGDLSEFSSKKEVRAEAQKQKLGGKNPMNITKACYEFTNVMKKDDVIIAKKGQKILLGYGIVTSDYYYDDSKEYPNRRDVQWIRKGEWDDEETLRGPMVLKTLTDITKYPKYAARIRALLGIDEGDSYTEQEGSSYTEQDALRDLFIPKDEFQEIMEVLKWKNNIILKGPPGVGKTFVCKRIAYTLIGSKDDSAIEMIQFHQSYSYEDFIQGYRPTSEGSFEIKDGLFIRLCAKAKQNPGTKYCLIIDEINRGNLSKIFGELMLLIEKDKRGKEFAVSLPYADLDAGSERFYIPENVFIIGTMNTADRSLAMFDYALRRRFAFIDLQPRFMEPKFSKYLKKRGVSGKLTKKIVNRLKKLNDRISSERTLGSNYRIGHSYFCPTDEGRAYDEKWYKEVVNYEIIPLLEEYWFDKDDDFIGDERNSLLGN